MVRTTKNSGSTSKNKKSSASRAAKSAPKAVAPKKRNTSSAKSAPAKSSKRPGVAGKAKPVDKSKKTAKTNAKPIAKAPSAKATSKPITTAKNTKSDGKGSTAPKSTPKKASPAKKAAKASGIIDLEVVSLGQKGKAPRRVLRPKHFPEIPTQQNFGHSAGTPEIPENYGFDRLVIMPKDPEWLFAYWELTPHRMENAWKERLSGNQYQEALKLTWQAQGLFEPNYVFLPVEFTARKWYLAVPGDTSRSYRLELGWLGENGHFISLLQSEPTAMPESWTVTRERLLAEGTVSAYTAKRTVNLGSSERAVLEESRGLFPLENLSSSLFSSSSLAMAHGGSSLPAQVKVPEAQAKVEVNGTVPKGSVIRLGGQVFKPDAQGRFKAAVKTSEPTLHLEVISPEGDKKFFAYDLSTPSA